jgi:hypothetical protein
VPFSQHDFSTKNFGGNQAADAIERIAPGRALT